MGVVHLRLPSLRALSGATAMAVSALAIVTVVAPPRVAHADSTFNADLLALLNQDRGSHGLAPLQSSSALGALAESESYGGCGYSIAGRAEDMIQRNYFSHYISSCGNQTVFNVMRADGVSFGGAAENLGYASNTADAKAAAQYVNTQFMNSSEHAGNVLNTSYTTVGIGSWWTASGQTWSGAGSAMSNVVVASVVFTDSPRPPGGGSAPAPVPVHHYAPPPPPRPAVATLALAVAPPPPAPQAPAPALPETGALGVVTPDVDDMSPAHQHNDSVAFETASWRVLDDIGSSSVVVPGSQAAVLAAVLLAAVESLRRLRADRRMHRAALSPPV